MHLMQINEGRNKAINEGTKQFKTLARSNLQDLQHKKGYLA
jgi:hypothetical protein